MKKRIDDIRIANIDEFEDIRDILTCGICYEVMTSFSQPL
jgi:hypothetical protein